MTGQHETNRKTQRAWIFTGLLAVEGLCVVVFPHPWSELHQGVVGAVVFLAALGFFGRGLLGRDGFGAVDRRWAAAHGLALAALAAADVVLLRLGARWALPIWYGTIALLPISAAGALFSLRRLLGLGTAWVYAGLTALAALFGRNLLDLAWEAPGSRVGQALQGAAFRETRWLLGLFYRQVVSEPATAVLGTPRFEVQISGPCSGMEGLALMLALSLGWLLFARRELRMARAVWLVPVAMAAMWGLNVMRIAALIALGDAGHEAMAVGGFHSEAGWIAFNAVAIGFLLLANRADWLRKDAAPAVAAAENRVAIFLMPFLAILAAALAAGATASGFEWLYPLRLVAAGAVFFVYRRQYGRMDWRFGWLGPAAGVAVFAIWLGFAHYLMVPGAGAAMAAGLAGLNEWQRIVWLAARVLAAVVTVPLAEELAFRGFVARRMGTEDFESLPYRAMGWVGIAVSSVLFGAMHGRLWLAGAIAGVAFALVAKLKDRLGEAVAAHATANLLIAVWVLARGDYSLW